MDKYKTIPVIRVFRDDASIIEKFKQHGFICFYDHAHNGDRRWLEQYYEDSEWRGFVKSFIWEMLDDTGEFPDFVISFDSMCEITKRDWGVIYEWIQQLLDDKQIDPSIQEAIGLLLDKPPVLTANTFSESGGSKLIPPDHKLLKSAYEFRYLVNDEMDVGVYEVIRPGSLPFTVVVWPFSEKGHTYFFTDICAVDGWCRSYNYHRYDFWFMQQVWKQLMGGELTTDIFDSLLEKRTASCYPTKTNPLPSPEPMVYQKNMDDVIEHLRQRGFGQKRA